jgi:hypothetical protein
MATTQSIQPTEAAFSLSRYYAAVGTYAAATGPLSLLGGREMSVVLLVALAFLAFTPHIAIRNPEAQVSVTIGAALTLFGSALSFGITGLIVFLITG